jgi:hypothetical protein
MTGVVEYLGNDPVATAPGSDFESDRKVIAWLKPGW